MLLCTLVGDQKDLHKHVILLTIFLYFLLISSAAALGEGAHHQTTYHTTKTGYRIQHTDLQAKASHATVNLLQTVKSPSHENRMKMIRMK